MVDYTQKYLYTTKFDDNDRKITLNFYLFQYDFTSVTH